MRRLSGSDALFLSMESGTAYQHVGGLVLLDPAGGGDFSTARIRETVGARLHLVPKFMWKLKEVPLNLDRPVWVEDTGFDLDRHIKRIAVPSPGGRREMGDLVGQLSARQLDRRFPLWEMWIIEGLNGGAGVGVYMKYHHCMMDGMTGASLADQLFDLEPNPAPSPQPATLHSEPGEVGEHDPSDLELLARSVVSNLAVPVRVAGYLRSTVERGAIIMWQKRGKKALPGLTAPNTILNGVLGPNRQSVFASVSLADLKRLRKELDVKVNDIVLAMTAGALRTYFQEQGDLPDGPLTTIVPVSTQLADDNGAGNQIATVPVALPTHLADPLERVQAVFDSTSAAKEMLSAVRARSIQSIGEVAPPLLLNLASRTIQTQTVAGLLPTAVTLVVSNVPGPPIPLYMSGAKVLGIYTSSVLMANMGCNITMLSYEDRVDFGISLDPDMVPNGHRIGELMIDSLAELLKAAGLGDPTPVEDPFTVVHQPKKAFRAKP
jgi:diacylglycerol O-acyltransferase